jgi:Icc-related predicted phosphoesterase
VSARFFYATDLHSSEACFRKLLAAPAAYEASTVIMGGDCTGKMLIPIVRSELGDWVCEWAGERHALVSEDEVAELERRIRYAGLYPVRLSQSEAGELANSDRLEQLFSRQMLETLAQWVELAEERLAPKGVRVIMTPGNDDEFAVDEVLRAGSYVEAPEGGVTRLGQHEMLSIGWSNHTPWHTPRECSEEDLAGKIDALAEQIEDMPNAIFNIHVPPYGTGLDDAPELDEDLRPIQGGSVSKAVGSTAVRDALLKHQPLLSLHGHIHESRGVQKLGRTTAINPGSVYGEGVLQGVVVELRPGSVRQTLTTG